MIIWEVPVIIKFNYNKRFKKILNNYKEIIPENYKVKDPIFKRSEINLSKELKNEANNHTSIDIYNFR